MTAAAATVLVGLVSLGVSYWRTFDPLRQAFRRQHTTPPVQGRVRPAAGSDARGNRGLLHRCKPGNPIGTEGFPGSRARLLEKPRRFYEELTRDLELASAERGRSLLARGRAGFGGILHMFGRYQEAEQQFEVAIALYREMVQAMPEVTEYREKLADSYAKLGSTGSFQATARCGGSLRRSYSNLLQANTNEPQFAAVSERIGPRLQKTCRCAGQRQRS